MRTMSKLYIRYAAMNAGKSTALLQVAHNYEERGMKVRLFTAAHDERTGPGIIGSRLGLQRPTETFGPDTEFDDLSPATRPANMRPATLRLAVRFAARLAACGGVV